ncbi:MAG: hypothetical protein KDB29_15350 [Planctomycetes bacterium]|nr:hypothetical protein [Planctomycetota bacterium]
MDTLPNHGRIKCSRCFAGGRVEFDKTRRTQGDWRISANPMAWGNSKAQIVVLGFSKGPTQVGALASAPHDEIAYKGGRTSVGKILQHVGVLKFERGETASEAVSRAIVDESGPFHFGSLIRCTVERFDQKDAAWKGSGGGMLDNFVATDFGRSVASNCVIQHLANLPSTTKLVVMFGMGQKLNYVESAFDLYKSARGGQWRRINEVAYTDGKIVVVHVEHFKSLGRLVPDWLDPATERGHYGVMARETVAFALTGVKLMTTSKVTARKAAVPPAPPKKMKSAVPKAIASATSPEDISDVFSRRLSFVLKNGEEVFPVRVKNRQTGLIAFRVSKGGTRGNTKENGLEVEDEMEMVRYVLEMGYSVRASTLDKKTPSLYKPDGRSVAEIRIARK